VAVALDLVVVLGVLVVVTVHPVVVVNKRPE
jgi:hypothetical protein